MYGKAHLTTHKSHTKRQQHQQELSPTEQLTSSQPVATMTTTKRIPTKNEIQKNRQNLENLTKKLQSVNLKKKNISFDL